MIPEIENGVPIPKKASGVKKYPFEDLKVGQSFWTTTSSYTMSPLAYKWGKELGRKFTVRSMSDGTEHGVRVWRVA